MSKGIGRNRPSTSKAPSPDPVGQHAVPVHRDHMLLFDDSLKDDLERD
jgi:hypothetical protein